MDIDYWVYERGSSADKYMLFHKATPHNILAFEHRMESTWNESTLPESERKELGANVLDRPSSLATDTATTEDVIKHALKAHDRTIDILVLLQPTSPFRNSNHIQDALALFSNDIDMVVSVKKTSSNPYYVLFEENETGYLEKSKKGNFNRRQDCPEVWEFNGAIYVINNNALMLKSISMS